MQITACDLGEQSKLVMNQFATGRHAQEVQVGKEVEQEEEEGGKIKAARLMDGGSRQDRLWRRSVQPRPGRWSLWRLPCPVWWQISWTWPALGHGPNLSWKPWRLSAINGTDISHAVGLPGHRMHTHKTQDTVLVLLSLRYLSASLPPQQDDEPWRASANEQGVQRCNESLALPTVALHLYDACLPII